MEVNRTLQEMVSEVETVLKCSSLMLKSVSLPSPLFKDPSSILAKGTRLADRRRRTQRRTGHYTLSTRQ